MTEAKKRAVSVMDSTSTLMRRANALNRLGNDIKPLMPRSARSATRVANYGNGKLVLETATNKARLDIVADKVALIKKIAKHIPKITEIEVKVNPSMITPPVKPNQRSISEQTADILECVSNMTPPGLSQALRKLASHKTSNS